MAELANYIPDLEGLDIKVFLENLEHELTKEEIKEVREWAFNISKRKCYQCGHEWISRIDHPHMCAKCHSVLWDKEP